MREVEIISAEVLNTYPAYNIDEIDRVLKTELSSNKSKVVVLDDDPTGIQTVHGISVYTDWKYETIKEAFLNPDRMFFILTNSRGFTVPQTTEVHRDIAKRVVMAADETKTDFILISRGDSTLRGHYPLETEMLKTTIEESSDIKIDGEIIFPFFEEGGRYTIDDIHYVKEGENLVPAGLTEFAKDKSFGYSSSDLTDWCEEKSGGKICATNVVTISLTDLRATDYEKIENQLLAVKNYGKVVVNSISYTDVKVFITAFFRAVAKGARFIFRSAAAVTKVIGGIPDKPLLTTEELVDKNDKNGGIIIVGSHVKKTTMQLEKLHDCKQPLQFICFDQHLVLKDGGLEGEVTRVVEEASRAISDGISVAVYTRRDRLDLDTKDADKQLEISVAISDAVTSIVEKITVKPRFIIAKGGITSSDVGTKALGVRKALVMGQIRPGIPVWQTGEESKFPNMPYIIFPGNVGTEETLLEAVEILIKK